MKVILTGPRAEGAAGSQCVFSGRKPEATLESVVSSEKEAACEQLSAAKEFLSSRNADAWEASSAQAVAEAGYIRQTGITL